MSSAISRVDHVIWLTQSFFVLDLQFKNHAVSLMGIGLSSVKGGEVLFVLFNVVRFMSVLASWVANHVSGICDGGGG